ncbi:MAG: molybdate ABC transporter substrate-binding protein [Clostridiales Family XIII bacterium]|jgi:molybdate transport system substrate-binding protein|nr:molybdate ABC transporter substrate-binding protein [Clostridiales Family XIII bacterium]
MKRKSMILQASVLALALFLAACGGSAPAETGDGQGSAGAATEAESAAGGQDAAGAQDAAGVELNVSAAASLTDALEEIYAGYRSESSDTIAFNFAASGTLQKQIAEGAPCDIFISASKGHMDTLDEEGLVVDGTRSDLLGNSLTLVAAAEKADAVRLDKLDSADVGSIAIGEPESVPAGQYAKQAFESMGIWDSVQEKLIFGKDVKQVQEYVDTGNVDCGLVYRSDALMMSTGSIIGDLPEDSHSPIVYPAALMADSENGAAAGAFLEFLKGDYARGVFENYGFKVL